MTVDDNGNETVTPGADWAYDSEHNDILVRGDFWDDQPPGSEVQIIGVPASSAPTP